MRSVRIVAVDGHQVFEQRRAVRPQCIEERVHRGAFVTDRRDMDGLVSHCVGHAGGAPVRH